MRRLLLLSLLLCLFLPVGCTKDRNTTEAAREPATTLTDSQLEKRIEAKINSDTRLREADLSVEVNADRNMVTLSGTVESYELRSKAAEMARAAQPGLKVENKIEVTKGEMSRSEASR